jgi:hypothetical protein
MFAPIGRSSNLAFGRHAAPLQRAETYPIQAIVLLGWNYLGTGKTGDKTPFLR